MFEQLYSVYQNHIRKPYSDSQKDKLCRGKVFFFALFRDFEVNYLIRTLNKVFLGDYDRPNMIEQMNGSRAFYAVIVV